MTPFFYAGFDTIPQQAEEAAEGLDWNKFGKIISLALLARGRLLHHLHLLLRHHRSLDRVHHQGRARSGLPEGHQHDLLRGDAGHRHPSGPMGPMNSFFGATSRIMLAMGRKGQLPASFAVLDAKSGCPKMACTILGVITVVGPFLGKTCC